MRTLTMTVRHDRVEFVRQLDGETYHTKTLPIGGTIHWAQLLRESAEGLVAFDRQGDPVFMFVLNDKAPYRVPVQHGWHVIGRDIDGKRHKFARVFSDREYDALFRNKGYLPKGYAGFHGGTADIVRVVGMPIIKRQVKSPVERTLNTDPCQTLKRFDNQEAQ